MIALRAGAPLCAAAIFGLVSPAVAQEREPAPVLGPAPPASTSQPPPSSAPPLEKPPAQAPQPPPRRPPPQWTPYVAPPPHSPAPQRERDHEAERKPDRPAYQRARERGVHVHEGFYFRLGLGVGLLRTASSFEGSVGALPADEAIGELTYSGYGLAVDGAIGGSPVRGVALGYGFAWQIADDPTLSVENAPNGDSESERTDPLGTTIHGVFVDVFPDPEGNLELGGLIGLATVGTGGNDNASHGVAAAVWGGYGVWAGSQFSLIALLRLSLARTTSEYSNSSSPFASPSATEIDRLDMTVTVGVLTGFLVN